MKNKTKFGLMSVIIVTVLIVTGFSGCTDVESLIRLGEGAFPKWSPDGSLVAFNKKVDGIYEIFTMKPNGSQLTCLTCNKSALANCGHKGQPYWYPNGKYIVFTAENISLPKLRLGLNALPDCGRNHNVWIMTADASKFWQITNYENNWGVISPSFSHNGKMIYWNEEYGMEKYPGVGSKWSVKLNPKGEELGLWRLKIADISFKDENPIISNERTININEIHPNLRLIEGTGFIPGDQGLVFSADDLSETSGRMFWGEIYTTDLNGVGLKRLTHTPFKHDENAEFSPDGKRIVWSTATGGLPGKKVDLFIMGADGGNKMRLTHFSEMGYPEYIPEYIDKTHGCGEIAWSPDGNSIIFAFGIGEDISQQIHTLYLLTLEKSSECLMGTNLSPGIIQDSTSNYTLDYMDVLLSDEDIRGLYDWSNDGQWISYMRMGADGLFDAYRIHPNGTDDECLTCGHPGLPDEVHKGAGDFDPSGRWMLFPVEKDDHWLPWFHGACIPGAGRYNDLWVMDMENQIQNPGYYDVYRIRGVRLDRSPPGGSLHPHFSNDGTKILWTDLQNTGDYYGDWQIAVADFKTDPWPPYLENMTFYEPAEVDYWYETHGWGPDDSWIYFTCTDVPGMDTNAMDIGRMDFSNPNDVTRLTFTSGINGEPKAWDEHAHLSPLGDVFEWASSYPYGVQHDEEYGDWLKLDQWMMNTNGTGHMRRTYFNEPGHEHYTGEHTISGGGCWNPAAGGTEIAITRSLIGSEIREIVILHYNIGSKNNGTSNYHRINLSLLPTGDGGHGGRPDWSHDGKWIAYDHKENDGYWDVCRIHPDGSGEECLTCDHPNLPNRHMGNPAFSPDGHWLVMTVEKESHPGGSTIALPGAGGYNDLWVMDISLDSLPYDVYLIHSVNDGFPAGGSLHPVFSHDGTKLFWSDRTGGGGEFGDWRLVIADFITTPSPHLENYQFYEPGDRNQWYESHGWGLDDSWIYFTGSPLMGMSDECMDICRMDFSDPNNVERLTWTSGVNGEDCEWDEHAHMNPRGDIMCWSSSMPYGYSERDSHQSDFWIMNLDGSGKRQVTFFNDPNPPNASWDEYDSGGRRCSDKAWNPDGTKLVFFSFDSGTGEHYYEDDQYLYILEFFINELGNQPPNKPAKPSGETNCEIGTEYEYTFTATDSDGDNVYYYIEWGDDIVDGVGWIGPYGSGEEITVNHTWSKRGNYNIKAKAKDIYDAESEWSDPLPITTPKNKQSLNWLHLRFLDKIMECFPLLEQQLRSVLMWEMET